MYHCSLRASHGLPGHLGHSGATCHTRDKDQHLLFCHPKCMWPSLCINQTFLRLVSVNRFTTTLSCLGENKRPNWVYRYLKPSALGALIEIHWYGPSGFTPAEICKTGWALPQGSQVPQSYPVTNGCSREKIIKLRWLGHKWRSL